MREGKGGGAREEGEEGRGKEKERVRGRGGRSYEARQFEELVMVEKQQRRCKTSV